MPRDKNAAINILEEGLRILKENMLRPSVEGYNKPSLITTILAILLIEICSCLPDFLICKINTKDKNIKN